MVGLLGMNLRDVGLIIKSRMFLIRLTKMVQTLMRYLLMGNLLLV